MNHSSAYTERFLEITDTVRAATRVPTDRPVTRQVTRFQIASEIAALVMAVSQGSASGVAAILTWAVGSYMRKVGRGDAVVLAVPLHGSPGRWCPVRLDISLEDSVKASLVRVRDALRVQVDDSDALDLSATAAALELSPSDRDNGVCDTAVIFASENGRPEAAFPASIALGVRFHQRGLELHGELHWQADSFGPADIAVMPNHLDRLLRVLVGDLSTSLAGISLLSPAETTALVDAPNRTSVDRAGPDSVSQAFAVFTARNPDQTATIVGDKQLSYADLASRVDRVAAALIAGGVAPGSRVGLMARRDDWLAPALLGILKAGCAYVPLDPEYPEERTRWVLEDCGAAALIVSAGVSPRGDAPRTFFLDEIPHTDKDTIFPKVSRTDAAYLIYTSGSTGTPKGVRIDHANVLNFFAGMDAVVPRSGSDTWLAITSISFDISVLEILWTLCRGIRVVIQESGRLLDDDAPAGHPDSPDFSLFFFADCDADQAADQYRLLFRATEYADSEGMAAVWVPERHFHRFGGLFPNPSLAAAALAARTRRIALRAGSVVAPLHNPLRVAEEWSFVDNISAGRVGVSFASGWNPRDFVLAPGKFAGRRDTLFQDIDLVRRFWRGEAVTLSDGENEHDLHLYPRPVQAELPVWITASNSIETFAKAGAVGANILTHLLHHSLEALEKKIRAYREAWREHHSDASPGTVTLMVHTFIGESERNVLEVVKAPFLRYLRSSAELMRAALPEGVDGAELSGEDRDAILEAAFSRFFEERGLFGTPRSCVAKVRRLQSVGVDEIACLVDFIPDPELVYRHLPHIVALQSLLRVGGVQRDVAGQMAAHHVTHLQCTPSLARALMESQRFRDALRHLKVFAVGGEVFPSGLQTFVRECSDAAVLNMYGPTEATVWSAVHTVTTADGDVPIGRPIANTRIYVLAPDLSPLPANRAGELYIGGDGVAAGYWNRPGLSAEKFVRDPFSDHPGARLYRTGDLALWDSDGRLRFLGREDRQVKIRGHRVELGEIEGQLQTQQGIQQAVVVNLEIGNSSRICAYYRADSSVDEGDIKAALASGLPAYMVPEFLIRLETIPLTPNRKVDIKALPIPGEPARIAGPARLGPVEITLLQIWERVLGRADLGAHDDFFRSGGDSIQAIQVAAQASAAGIAVSPKMLYEHPTVAALARVVAVRPSARFAEPLPEEPFGLLPAQRWFFEMEVANRSHWNQSALLTLRSGAQPAPLQAAVQAAFARHPAFRVRFKHGDEGWSQFYDPARDQAVAYRVQQWRLSPKAKHAAGQIAGLADEAHHSLDIEAGPMVAAVHVTGFPGGDRLILSVHHLVIDGLSWRVILEDIGSAYGVARAGGAPALPPAPGPHHLVRLVDERAASADGVEAGAFWNRKLSEVPAPVWEGIAASTERQCQTWLEESVGPTERDLASATECSKTDAEVLVLAAFVGAVRSAGMADGFAVDMESHGRGGAAADDPAAAAVGWMTRIYPLLIPPGTDDLAETLRQVKVASSEVARYKDAYHRRSDTAVDGADRHVPSPQIIFNYLGQLDASVVGSDLFTSFRLSPGQPRDPDAVRHHDLEVNVYQAGEGLVWEFIHPPAHIRSADIKRLAKLCATAVEELIVLCRERAAECLVSEDFPGAGLALDEIRDLAQRPGGLEDAYSATPHQRAIFYQLHACPSDRSRFVHQALLSVRGCEDENLLEAALQRVAARHRAFRSSFAWSRSGTLLQSILHDARMPVRRMDWSALSVDQVERRLAALRKLDLEQGVDPGTGPLARAVIVRTSPASCLLLWTYHHLIADGWSLSLVIRDLNESYRTGRDPSGPVGDFGVFARWITQVDRRAQEAFWARYLDGMKAPVPLSSLGRKTDYSYPVEYGLLEQASSEEAMDLWQRRARENGATLPAMLQAAWGLAVCRASQTNESVFGITVAGRPAGLSGVEHAIGLFISSVPCRFRLRPTDTPVSLVRRMHDEGSTLREHAYVESAALNRMMGLQAGEMAFETVLVVQNFIAPEPEQESGTLHLDVLDFVERNPTPLTIEVVPGNRLTLRYVFDSRHFHNSQVLDLHRGLLAALDSLAKDPSAPIQRERNEADRQTVQKRQPAAVAEGRA
ncbi:MAG: MupA/Atu3671 family FMN-dependent luciferase-like monooxygenase [Nannocystaceae bacterium]